MTSQAQAPGWLSASPRQVGDELTIDIRGEADVSTATHLREQLSAALQSTPRAVVIDVSGLTFCGVAGLDALEDALVSAKAAGTPIKIVGMSRQLAWLVEMSRGKRAIDGRAPQ